MISSTPPPPYYAVIFTSIRNENLSDYAELAVKMDELAKMQPGYLGMESVKNDIGITVSYWESLEAIRSWKMNSDHLFAQKKGREEFYSAYKVRIAKVERDYGL